MGCSPLARPIPADVCMCRVAAGSTVGAAGAAGAVVPEQPAIAASGKLSDLDAAKLIRILQLPSRSRIGAISVREITQVRALTRSCCADAVFVGISDRLVVWLSG